MNSKSAYKIPFFGNKMLEYVSNPCDSQITWRDNANFLACVRLTGTHRGRSSARVICQSLDNGEIYSMGLEAFYQAVRHLLVKDGEITGWWCFRKQGSNYSLYPVVA